MDPKIYEGIIKPKVIDLIKEYVQNMFQDMEKSFILIQTIISEMREHKADENIILNK